MSACICQPDAATCGDRRRTSPRQQCCRDRGASRFRPLFSPLRIEFVVVSPRPFQPAHAACRWPAGAALQVEDLLLEVDRDERPALPLWTAGFFERLPRPAGPRQFQDGVRVLVQMVQRPQPSRRFVRSGGRLLRRSGAASKADNTNQANRRASTHLAAAVLANPAPPAAHQRRAAS